ncbi:alcohol dehydrogenase [Lachnellula arida]|uniref:Alcohol dehydrogenase n=1 Tax=Lachnellula arida TaxID=1316785 RepID=A0A8T9B496_9HELO|nr:alcohol dehydrogenase [Lachnellula arida]
MTTATSPTTQITYLSGSPTGAILTKSSTRILGNREVLVRVTHSGLCGTDVHDRTAGCGLGHEGVGIVEKVGVDVGVTSVEVGDRVGLGWQFSSCGHCRECIAGYRQYCPESKGQKYGETEQGAFGDFVVKDQDFVYHVPVEIESRFAGPLMCAGITVFEALDVAGAKPSDRVGVVGFGGLGHLAVLYARAMGCETVVFSRSTGKRGDAMMCGATEFCVVPEAGGKLDVEVGVDILLLCGNGLPDFEQFMPVLARRATIVPLIIQGEPLVVPYMPFMLPGHRIILARFNYSISASTEASRRNHIDALTFAARHNIRPWIQEFPMTEAGLAKALDLLEHGKIKYRAVLTVGLRDDVLKNS